MSVIVDGTNGIDTVQKAALVGKLPAGTVLQVVSVNYSTYYTNSTASGAFVDVSGFSASITPSSASNKILCICSVQGVCTYVGNTTLQGCILQIADGGGNKIFGVIDQYIPGGAGSSNWGAYGASYLHSPASTSSLTYKLQYKMSSTGIQINNYQTSPGSSGYSNLILMEIAA